MGHCFTASEVYNYICTTVLSLWRRVSPCTSAVNSIQRNINTATFNSRELPRLWVAAGNCLYCRIGIKYCCLLMDVDACLLTGGPPLTTPSLCVNTAGSLQLFRRTLDRLFYILCVVEDFSAPLFISKCVGASVGSY